MVFAKHRGGVLVTRRYAATILGKETLVNLTGNILPGAIRCLGERTITCQKLTSEGGQDLGTLLAITSQESTYRVGDWFHPN